jgi:mannose-6-phosphate isomerase
MTRRVAKPWGHEVIFAETERYVGKILHISAGHRLSLQYHEMKDETIYVMAGEVDLVVDENGNLVTRRLAVGEAYRIRPRVRHRLIAATDTDIAEVSTPELDDVVRLEDIYGRAGTSVP